jgi:hypothetical protein
MPAVPPVLLERLCDAGRSTMDASEAVKYAAELTQQHGEAFMLAHPYYPGCGTIFQWYWGMNCCCPECAHMYLIEMRDMKAGLYTPKSS